MSNNSVDEIEVKFPPRTRTESFEVETLTHSRKLIAKSAFGKEEEEVSESEADDYSLFDWSSEFDDIINDEYQEFQLCLETTPNRANSSIPKWEMKYHILDEFMSMKAESIRNSALSPSVSPPETETLKIPPPTKAPKGRNSMLVTSTSPSTSVNPLKIFKPRASFRVQNISDNMLNYGLKSVLEVPNFDYSDLIGYIDPLGMFCMNHSPMYLYSESRPSIDHPEKISLLSMDEIKLWRTTLETTFTLVTDVLLEEINKDKYTYKHQQNLIVKILKWNKKFEDDFDHYFKEAYTVSQYFEVFRIEEIRKMDVN